ncbi:hypothetical protein GBAR_LOCUS15764, partial [Geodia barretti]
TRYGNFRSVRHWKLAGTFSVCTVERFPVDLRLQFNPFPPFRQQKLFQKSWFSASSIPGEYLAWVLGSPVSVWA